MNNRPKNLKDKAEYGTRNKEMFCYSIINLKQCWY